MSDKEKSMLNRIVSMGEGKLTDLVNELMGNPKFASALGKAIQHAMDTKGKLDKNVAIALSAVNVPTKADYDNLAKKVSAVNKAIGELELRLDELIGRVNELAGKVAKPAAAPKAKAKTKSKK